MYNYKHVFFFFFLSLILCSNHISNDHPQEDLAKFGYNRSESKVNFQKKKESRYIFWLPSQVSTLYDDFRKTISSKSDNFAIFSPKFLYISHINFLIFLYHHVAIFFGQRRNATPYKFSPSSPPPSFVISPDMRNQTLGSTTIDDRNKEGRWGIQSIIGHVVWTGTHIPTYLSLWASLCFWCHHKSPQQCNLICTIIISQFSYQWSKKSY